MSSRPSSTPDSWRRQRWQGGRLAGNLRGTPAAYSVQTRNFIDALTLFDLNQLNF